MARFLTRQELYDRAGGQTAVRRVVAHLEQESAAQADAAIDQAIRSGESTVVSYTARYQGRMPTRPDETPEVIKDLVASLAREALQEQVRDQASEPVKERAKAALARLRDIAAGRARLDLPQEPVDDVRPTVTVVHDRSRPSFDRRSLEQRLL